MPWHRVINVLELEKVVWDNWPDFGANQFMSQGPDRLRTETQNRLPTHGATPARHCPPARGYRTYYSRRRGRIHDCARCLGTSTAG
jgi:hypothetical protein